MADRRLPSLRRPSVRETIAIAFAAAGVVAVAASSAVSMTDNSAPSRVAMVAEQLPAAETSAPVADPVAEAAPMPIPVPAPVLPPIPAPALPPIPAPALPPIPALPPVPAPMPAPAPPVYADNLDGWIRQALDVMQARSIPGSYDGLHRNIMRESSGNPRAINLWDSNAAAGTPSKGLLQVIDPTFQAYHVEGTSWDIYDPVANIAAACNYAAARYGSMDNVNGAY
ncbi:transglycosylase SLT domain-containing protein [Nocardia sp. CNY236]|uniref:transglycosylase SLT domain-containing protein n=1 Tax=Nocardia sp. CNY236 TaxID=1169152 RepID=UPI00040104E5|nr:transglycosylase SLT domain-containing protein [Nocardia sp. CNY236]